MTNRPRVVAAVVVVAAAAFAACRGLVPQSSTEQLSVVVGPDPGDFGAVEVGSSSTPKPFTVSPAGSGESDDTIQSITVPSCSAFAIQAMGVPGAPVFRHCGTGSGTGTPAFTGEADLTVCVDPTIKTFPFTATFTPVVTGTTTCTGVIDLGAGGTQSFTLKGFGVLPEFVIDVGPKSIGFGDIRRTTPSTNRAVTVTNAGMKDLTITQVTLTDPSGAFEITSGITGSHAIPMGLSEDYLVRCVPPSAPATFTGSLDISSNDPKNPIEQVSLTCNGIDSNLDVQPTSVIVPSTLVFLFKTSTVQLKNVGAVPGTINNVALDNLNPALSIMTKPADNTQLAPGNMVPVVVKYDPTQVQEGELGSLLVTFDGVVRTISISGEALLAKVSSEPTAAIPFGPVCSAKQSAPEPLDVYSEQDGEFLVMGASAAAPFAVSPMTLTPAKLMEAQRGTVARFTVTVTPASLPGRGPTPIEGMINVTTSAPMMGSYSIKATAMVLPAGITALPEEVGLGSIEVRDVSSAKTVTFTNCGDTAVEILGERIEGTNADEFALTKDFTAPIPVAPTETVEIDVQFRPRTVGGKQAQLVLDYTGASETVNLVGDGTAAPRDPRNTYYACSVGRAGAAWPIVLALFAILLRPRRRNK